MRVRASSPGSPARSLPGRPFIPPLWPNLYRLGLPWALLHVAVRAKREDCKGMELSPQTLRQVALKQHNGSARLDLLPSFRESAASDQYVRMISFSVT